MIYAQLSTEDEKFRLSFLSTEAQEAGQDTAAVADIAYADPELVARLEKTPRFRIRMRPRPRCPRRSRQRS